MPERPAGAVEAPAGYEWKEGKLMKGERVVYEWVDGKMRWVHLTWEDVGAGLIKSGGQNDLENGVIALPFGPEDVGWEAVRGRVGSIMTTGFVLPDGFEFKNPFFKEVYVQLGGAKGFSLLAVHDSDPGKWDPMDAFVLISVAPEGMKSWASGVLSRSGVLLEATGITAGQFRDYLYEKPVSCGVSFQQVMDGKYEALGSALNVDFEGFVLQR